MHFRPKEMVCLISVPLFSARMRAPVPLAADPIASESRVADNSCFGFSGNCLYYALSDQLYGDWSHFDEIRARLANHMTAHEDYFMSFTAAVGGERRAPRRAAAAKMSSSSYVGPAASVKDQRAKFENKVAESRKNGVWGGSEEIQAFCQSYKRDVRVYMESGIQNFRDVNAPENEEREVVHIAFHVSHLAPSVMEASLLRITSSIELRSLLFGSKCQWTPYRPAMHPERQSRRQHQAGE